MQKTNIKASILIWATFLSLIITITFVSISTSINKNIKNNSSLINQFKLNNQIKNIINSGSLDYNYKNQYLDNGDKIIFEPANIHIQTLKKGEIILGKVNVNSNISIKVLKGGATFYKQNTASGLIIKGTPNTFSNDGTGTFSIKSLGGISQVQITSDSFKNYLGKYRDYTIYKTIGNKEIIKTTGKIKIF